MWAQVLGIRMAKTGSKLTEQTDKVEKVKSP